MLLLKKRRTAVESARLLFAFGFGLLLGERALAVEKLVLSLKNGDRLSGELISENDQRLIIKSSLVGEVQILKADVAKRESVTPAAPAPKTEKPAVKPVAAVTNAAPTLPSAKLSGWLPSWVRPFTTNWHGNVQLGMDLGFGTSDRQTFYVNSSASHTWDRLRNFADFHSAYGLVNKIESANRMDGSLKTETDLGKGRRIYAYNQGGASYDAIRQLNLEYHEGLGLGYKILQKPKINLNSEVGLQYQNFDYLTAATADSSFVSLRIGENLTWTVFEKLSLNQRLALTPNVQDFGEYHVRFDLGLSYPLFKRVTLNLNLIDQYESKPPLGVRRNDLQIQSTLGLTF
jgi:Protein of unknown function, DUF481